jgi:hypothetical protein
MLATSIFPVYKFDLPEGNRTIAIVLGSGTSDRECRAVPERLERIVELENLCVEPFAKVSSTGQVTVFEHGARQIMYCRLGLACLSMRQG